MPPLARLPGRNQYAPIAAERTIGHRTRQVKRRLRDKAKSAWTCLLSVNVNPCGLQGVAEAMVFADWLEQLVECGERQKLEEIEAAVARALRRHADCGSEAA